jgi:hypothetical protein
MDRRYVAYLLACVAAYAADAVHVPAPCIDALTAIAPAELAALLLPWDGPCVEFRAGSVVVGRATI